MPTGVEIWRRSLSLELTYIFPSLPSQALLPNRTRHSKLWHLSKQRLHHLQVGFLHCLYNALNQFERGPYETHLAQSCISVQKMQNQIYCMHNIASRVVWLRQKIWRVLKMLKSNLLGVTLNGIQKRGIIKYTSRSRKKYRCNTADSAVYWVLLCFTIQWMMAPILFAEVSGKYTSWYDRMSNNTQQWEMSCI